MGENLSRLRVTVHGVNDATIRVLIDGSYPAGSHELAWDGRDGHNRRVSSGVYFLRVTGGGETITRKIVHVR